MPTFPIYYCYVCNLKVHSHSFPPVCTSINNTRTSASTYVFPQLSKQWKFLVLNWALQDVTLWLQALPWDIWVTGLGCLHTKALTHSLTPTPHHSHIHTLTYWVYIHTHINIHTILLLCSEFNPYKRTYNANRNQTTAWSLVIAFPLHIYANRKKYLFDRIASVVISRSNQDRLLENTHISAQTYMPFPFKINDS